MLSALTFNHLQPAGEPLVSVVLTPGPCGSAVSTQRSALLLQQRARRPARPHRGGRRERLRPHARPWPAGVYADGARGGQQRPEREGLWLMGVYICPFFALCATGEILAGGLHGGHPRRRPRDAGAGEGTGRLQRQLRALSELPSECECKDGCSLVDKSVSSEANYMHSRAAQLLHNIKVSRHSCFHVLVGVAMK